MGRPIATTTGICFAFPDVRLTPSPTGQVPMPYPNVAQLSAADEVADDVKAGGKPVVVANSTIDSSSGGEAGTGGPVTQTTSAHCVFESASKTVRANGQGVVRQGDATLQDLGNARGTVMVGLPTVLVGG